MLTEISGQIKLKEDKDIIWIQTMQKLASDVLQPISDTLSALEESDQKKTELDVSGDQSEENSLTKLFDSIKGSNTSATRTLKNLRNHVQNTIDVIASPITTDSEKQKAMSQLKDQNEELKNTVENIHNERNMIQQIISKLIEKISLISDSLNASLGKLVEQSSSVSERKNKRR